MPRNALDDSRLIDLFSWSEAQFLHRLEGSPIRRIGYPRWLRNIAVALGNTPADQATVQALAARLNDSSELVAEHVGWALQRLTGEG